MDVCDAMRDACANCLLFQHTRSVQRWQMLHQTDTWVTKKKNENSNEITAAEKKIEKSINTVNREHKQTKSL